MAKPVAGPAPPRTDHAAAVVVAQIDVLMLLLRVPYVLFICAALAPVLMFCIAKCFAISLFVCYN